MTREFIDQLEDRIIQAKTMLLDSKKLEWFITFYGIQSPEEYKNDNSKACYTVWAIVSGTKDDPKVNYYF